MQRFRGVLIAFCRQYWEPVVAICALFTAVAALFVSYFQVVSSERHQRLSVRPELVFEHGWDTEDFVGLKVSNAGLGPALLRQFTVRLDGKLMEDRSELINLLRLKDAADWLTWYDIYLAEANYFPIKSDDTVQLFGLWIDPDKCVDRARAVIVYESLCRISIDVEYCSMYEECKPTSHSSVSAEECRMGNNEVVNTLRDEANCE